MTDTPCIHIDPVSGDGWRVSIVPAPQDEEEQSRWSFESHRKARSFALGLRLTKGWPIVDEHEWLSSSAPKLQPKKADF